MATAELDISWDAFKRRISEDLEENDEWAELRDLRDELKSDIRDLRERRSRLSDEIEEAERTTEEIGVEAELGAANATAVETAREEAQGLKSELEEVETKIERKRQAVERVEVQMEPHREDAEQRENERRKEAYVDAVRRLADLTSGFQDAYERVGEMERSLWGPNRPGDVPAPHNPVVAWKGSLDVSQLSRLAVRLEERGYELPEQTEA